MQIQMETCDLSCCDLETRFKEYDSEELSIVIQATM